ncbi:UTP--glucose-1-phosphate uridylyltransferase [candidate division KSB1 bacterium]|nr:UTP--glucose-1-phosphate uridylyltransferase [candidate division KSB1 bacterium]
MQINKAVIPAAGLGTRLFPLTKAVKKEFFPIVTREGIVKPVIQLILEEALTAGVQELGVVIRPEDELYFKKYFSALPETTHQQFVKNGINARLAQELVQIGQRITYIFQHEQQGFGHAVYCAREWVAGEPFLLMLGDHLYHSTIEQNCARQLIDVYTQYGTSVSAVSRTQDSRLQYFGTVTGEWLAPEKGIFQVTELCEKPDSAYAETHLRMSGLPPDTYFCFFGMHVFENAIFDMLAYQIDHNLRENGEFQLTSAQERLRQHTGHYLGLEIKGQRFDMGVPSEYQKTMVLFGA